MHAVTRSNAAISLSLLFVALAAGPASAGPITLSAELVFDGPASDDLVSSPRLGEYSGGRYVVYEVRSDTDFGPGQGSVYAQRLTASGAASGNAPALGAQLQPAGMPDASGQWVVYEVSDPDGIRLHDLTTGTDFHVANALVDENGDVRTGIGNVRISNNAIVWDDSDVIFYQRIDLLGTGAPATVIRGPLPESGNPEVDSRYIVWQEDVGSAADSEVRAHEIGASAFFVTPGDFTDGFDEIDPVTRGDLIAFGQVDSVTGLADIILRDMLADTTRVFSPGLLGLDALSMSQDYLSFNAFDPFGVTQGFLLSLMDGELLQLTNGSADAGTTDVFGDFVTYTAGQQLYVAQISRDAVAVAEPATLALLCLGLAGLVVTRRRVRGGRA